MWCFISFVIEFLLDGLLGLWRVNHIRSIPGSTKFLQGKRQQNWASCSSKPCVPAKARKTPQWEQAVVMKRGRMTLVCNADYFNVSWHREGINEIMSSRVQHRIYKPIPSANTEGPDEYKWDDLHPVHIENKFKDGRYRIIHKLRYDSFSTVWLARDE